MNSHTNLFGSIFCTDFSLGNAIEKLTTQDTVRERRRKEKKKRRKEKKKKEKQKDKNRGRGILESKVFLNQGLEVVK